MKLVSVVGVRHARDLPPARFTAMAVARMTRSYGDFDFCKRSFGAVARMARSYGDFDFCKRSIGRVLAAGLPIGAVPGCRAYRYSPADGMTIGVWSPK
jgi:hypothetical protein